MQRGGSRLRSRAGLTLVELVASIAVMSIVVGSILMATLGVENVFLENQLISQLNLQMSFALDRAVETASQALTTDAQFTALKPSSGVNSHCIRFRLMQSIDPATGNVTYDDNAQVYLYGPDTGSSPCRGLIVGRGPDLASISTTASGPDGFLGTPDDDTRVVIASGVPAVQLLVPDRFAPQTGDMFTVKVTPAPIGRLLTITLRLNVRNLDGSFILPNDMVMTESVALRG